MKFYVIVGREPLQPFLFPVSRFANHSLRRFIGKQNAVCSGERLEVPIRRLGLSMHKMQRTKTIEMGY